ncbi:hypothetical protein KGA66_24395 [Actinocrinis puniceicyclus]|uniref:Uncharacterized protein n=1 Tax=Actinocrinis puniceicyclus TaxID=977794 RepID=A0A8J7WTJ2_9ACTN|nr:hypothetical protein [Actinocrinis puniceicyclus]MBS2966207.1 hypothetical protein [Actinocrinis puniceicyclus]
MTAAGVWALWPSSRPTYDPPHNTRQYIAFTACLLTGPAGLADPRARAVWSGMQAASSATNAQVSYVAAAVGQAETIGSVTPFANSLVQQRCGVIVAVGPVEVATMQAVAAGHAEGRFVLVGGGSAASNIAVVPPSGGSSIASRVQVAVQAAVRGSFRSGVFS